MRLLERRLDAAAAGLPAERGPLATMRDEMVAAAQVAAQAVARVDGTGAGGGASIMDCGPGGCGGGLPGWGGLGPSTVAVTPSLDRATIDDICTDQLMWRIVTLLVDDAMGVTPTLSGETGELTPCIEWLNARGFWAEAKRAQVYSRQYGGGGVVCFVDDGRPMDQEIDPLGCHDVVGFYALPKWYLVPDGVGSPRVRSAWYGQRIGRPEHYFVTPVTAMGSAATLGGGGGGAGGTRPAGGGGASISNARQRAVMEVAAEDLARMPADVRRLLAKSGNRFHRSRIIPWPYRDDMDLRLARWLSQWNGWGPGVVEACLAPFLARRSGALRLAAIMNSIIVNTLTITDLEHRQSQPSLMAALQARLEFVKWCRDYMSDSLPIIATDPSSTFSSLNHNVSGIDKVIEAQRQYLLDVLEYPGVVLFGDSVGGMNGGDRKGEWRAYAARVKAIQESWVWTAGSFGGGLKQAVGLAMLCREGPTRGQYDPTVKATWPAILEESAEDSANTRLKNAQARAQDALTLDLSPDALLRHDPTVQVAYPSIDIDEGPLPTLAPATPGARVPSGATPAQASAAGGEGAPAETATTPGATNTALAEQKAGGESTDAPALPTDIHTEAEIAAAMKMTRGAVRKLIAEAGVRPFGVVGKGQRGGARYRLGEVLAAWQRQAEGRADAMRVR